MTVNWRAAGIWWQGQCWKLWSKVRRWHWHHSSPVTTKSRLAPTTSNARSHTTTSISKATMLPLFRHVSFMRICNCRILRLLPHFYIFFPHKLAFSTAILILFVFLLPISVRFRYLDHLLANRMAPSMCPDRCGTRWGSWFQAILYHISAAYLVLMRSAYFF